jgi:PAS domain S-box-containing protein
MEEYILESKILIIDDQQANIEVLVDLLTLKGYTNVHSLNDSTKSLSMIESIKPDVVLLDLMMPVMSGFDVMDQLNERQMMGYFMPILVLTADVTTETKRRALKAGASDFLTKPFDLTEVSIRIKNLLFNVYLFHQFMNQNMILEDKIAARTFDLVQKNEELKLLKVEVERNEEKYRTLFDTNLDGITVAYLRPDNGTSCFVEYNNAALDLFGYTGNELQHVGPFELEAEINQDIISDRISRLHSNDMIRYDAILRRKNGDEIIVEIKAIKVRYWDEDAILFITRNITDRMEYISAIEKQNLALKDIAWKQSHVVRAPLARLMSLVSLLSDDVEDPDYTKLDIMSDIMSSAHELDGVIKDITQKTALIKN